MPSVLHYPLCLLLDNGVAHSWVLFLLPFGLRLFLGVLVTSAVGSLVILGVVFFWLAIFHPSVVLSVSEVEGCPSWSVISFYLSSAAFGVAFGFEDLDQVVVVVVVIAAVIVA